MKRRPIGSYSLWVGAILMVTLISSQDPQHPTLGPCKGLWFGKGCLFMCRCARGHPCFEETGECPANVSCGYHMFGPSCQYVNWLSEIGTRNSPAFVNDGEENTCNPNPKATSLTVLLNTAVLFTWFRIYANRDISKAEMDVQLGNEGCPGRRLYRVSQNVLDISCESRVITQKLHLSGPGVANICEVKVSGGRNVALKQTTRQSSSFSKASYKLSRSSNAVDGALLNNISYGSCSNTDETGGNPWWILEYSRPQKIVRILIYNRNVYEKRLAGFVLELYSLVSSNSAHFVRKNDVLFIKDLYEIMVPASDKSVAKVKIWFQQQLPLSENILTLCEVETYGETICPGGNHYGLDCQETCKCGGDESCSVATGFCGSSCMAGVSGINCSLNCFPNCRDNICKRSECVFCLAGYRGAFCTELCPRGTHGFNCSQKCSPRCLGSTCNATTGYCEACVDNYRMPLCVVQTDNENDLNFSARFYWLFLLLLLPLIPLCMCMLFSFAKKRAFRPAGEMQTEDTASEDKTTVVKSASSRGGTLLNE